MRENLFFGKCCKDYRVRFECCQPKLIERPCKWTPWQDNDNPSGKGDYEKPPKNCKFEKYRIQLTSGGPIYNDVSLMPQVMNDYSYVYCLNANQPGCKVNSAGYPVPFFQKKCCKDYKFPELKS